MLIPGIAILENYLLAFPVDTIDVLLIRTPGWPADDRLYIEIQFLPRDILFALVGARSQLIRKRGFRTFSDRLRLVRGVAMVL